MDDTQRVTPMKMLKVSDVAKIFDVEPATVRVWLNDGTLEGVKIGKGHYWRIPEQNVIDLANRRYGSENHD